jgi:hypothetical protein
LLLSVLALAFGGILKGATGAGVPILAVPIMALYYDVRTAVIVMLMPSLLANVLQAWRYRIHLAEAGFAGRMALFGVLGAALGTMLLASVQPRYLLLAIAGLVLVFVGFRLTRPHWHLPRPVARVLAVPAGLAAGTLQGATGISAPISLTFLNACRLPRAVFIAVVSLYFVASTLMQLLGLVSYGMLTWQGIALSFGALALILAVMPLGEAIGRRFSPELFDRVTLVLLVAISVRILVVSL